LFERRRPAPAGDLSENAQNETTEHTGRRIERLREHLMSRDDEADPDPPHPRRDKSS